jgi:hypothetical protein
LSKPSLHLLEEVLEHLKLGSFVDYEKKVYDLANSILDVYMNKFVNKTNTIVPFYFKKIIYILHGDFLKSREQTNKFKIMNYLLLIDPKEICFMMNNIKKENDKNNVMEQ